MYKRILLSAGSLALLALGACDSVLENEIPCNPISNVTQSTAGDTVVTASGLRYIDLQTGGGANVQSCAGFVLVDYEGTLLNGTVFDPGLSNISFRPGTGDLIQGFEQGVLGMRVGGRRRLIIPPALGYGASPRTNPSTGEVIIPANSTLVFDVEILGVQE